MQNFLVKSASTIFQNVAFWNNFGHFPSSPHPLSPPPPSLQKKKKKKRHNCEINEKTFHVQIHELESEPNSVIATLCQHGMFTLLPIKTVERERERERERE